MAGIGFVLQKIMKKGGVFAFLKVAMAGTVIVAGPWLLSILGIFVISQFAGKAIHEAPQLFIGMVVYSYAFSLFLFGGIHHIFTRQIADMVFEKKRAEAGSSLILFSLSIFFLSVLVAAPVLFSMDAGEIAHPLFYRVGGILLFAAINLIWIIMIFVSLLNRYLLVTLAYFLGMTISFLGVFFAGDRWGVGGSMIGFALGQWFIVAFLYIMALTSYKPAKTDVRSFFQYFSKFKFLFFSGMLYYWGMWIDKMVYWFTVGTREGNSFFHIFDLYDIPVYLSNLSIIPGLIFFMLIGETNFYRMLMEFLDTLGTKIYKKIIIQKYKLIFTLRRGILDQILFQGVFTLILLLGASSIVNAFSGAALEASIFRLSLGAVFFHLIFLTLTIYLFYLQLYKQTFFTTLYYFLVNLGGSLLTVHMNWTHLYGLSFLVATSTACVISMILLLQGIRKYDRILFVQAIKG